MKLSFSWLNEYLQTDEKTIREATQTLNKTLTEVEGIEIIKPPFENIYIGIIKDIQKHPEADKLWITKVFVAESEYTIVCGAKNLYLNMKVPVAIPGSIVYTEDNKPFVIKPTEFRGILSEAMLCSARELHIAKDHSGILDLSSDHSLQSGDKLDPIFSDLVLAIENKALTRRPDCFSHYGIAKEIAAISTKKPVTYAHISSKDIDFEQQTIHEDTTILKNHLFSGKNDINLTVKGFTKRYATITIKNVSIKPSPAYIQARLAAVGLRPINNIVDLTNYVMLDIAQPLHAFDMDYTGTTFEIRTAKPGEKITTLYGDTFSLNNTDITITDGKKPLDIGGIIGGKESGVQASTKNIVLVADNFDASMLRRTSWRLGIRTDAVTIYEKGIDPNLALKGLIAFVHLYKEWYPEDAIEISSILDYYPNPEAEDKYIQLNVSDITALIGAEIPYKTIETNLALLDMPVVEKQKDLITVKVPSLRRDITIKEDIIEEVIRIYGYENLDIQPYFYKLRTVSAYMGRDDEIKAKTYLVDNGYIEIEPYAFAYSKTEEAFGLTGKKVQIKNPITIETDILKTSLLPEVIGAVEKNTRFYDSFGIFNLSRTFIPTDAMDFPIEEKYLAGAYYLKYKKDPQAIKQSYYQTKALIEGLFDRLRIPKDAVVFKKAQHIAHAMISPDHAAEIYIYNTLAGIIGVSSDTVHHIHDIENRFVLFELALKPILAAITPDQKLVSYSTLPSVSADISFFIDEFVSESDISEIIKGANPKYLVDLRTVDEYIKDEKTKSLTIGLVFNNPKKTLTSEQVSEQLESITTTLKEKFSKNNIVLR